MLNIIVRYSNISNIIIKLNKFHILDIYKVIFYNIITGIIKRRILEGHR
jgi:hypothetical protein